MLTVYMGISIHWLPKFPFRDGPSTVETGLTLAVPNHCLTGRSRSGHVRESPLASSRQREKSATERVADESSSQAY